MDSTAPVPKPRMNAVDVQGKKPIPKPRLKLLKNNPLSNSVTSQRSLVNEANEKDLFTRKNDCQKSACNTTEGKVKHTDVDKASTRFEKSVRSLTRRFTVGLPPPGKEPKVIRSQSLPSEDIFQTITFKSPIASEANLVDTLIENDAEHDCSLTYDAPPPVYPPPPLPDESMYDEVQSVASNSSSNKMLFCKRRPEDSSVRMYYEPIAIDAVAENKQSSSTGLPALSSRFLRSDSWLFYDTVSGENLGIEDANSSSVLGVKDNTAISERTLSRSSISPSLLSELDALSYNSGEENFEDDQNSTSTPRSCTSQSVSVQNELYDSWEPLKIQDTVSIRKKESERKLPTKSVILEFDPLYSRVPVTDSASVCSIESSVTRPDQTSVYGNACFVHPETKDGCAYNKAVVAAEPPPIPPRRIDSIQNTESNGSRETSVVKECLNISPSSANTGGDEQDIIDSAQYSRSQNEVILNDSVSREENIEQQRSKITRLASMKRAVRFVADTSNWSPSVMRRNTKKGSCMKDSVKDGHHSKQNIPHLVNAGGNMIQRPEILKQFNFPHSGLVYKVSSGRERQQDHVQRWCVLAEEKLTFYTDKSAMSIREVIALNSILSIGVVTDYKMRVDGDCFEINTASKGYNYTFGTAGASERRVWMQKILENLTGMFPLRIISDYTRGGWCYLKEGISRSWCAAWLLIHKRMLYYCLIGSAIQEIDLRKARCVALQAADESTSNLEVSEKGPCILLDAQGIALYLVMGTSRETQTWQKVIQGAAVDNGPNLDQQQLTKEDIPVIVDKCIKFIYAHGSMSEGIYRRSGSNSSVIKLLELFRLDAWSVHLSRQEYSEYDVSSVLKRFFRDIPEPLLTTELHGQFCDIAAGKLKGNPVDLYRQTLEKLPPVNFLTARKLIGHLHTIHEQREKNRMPVENLAAIWGPTLMHIETSDSLEWSRWEAATVANIIKHHVELFEVDAEEQSREKRMQEVLERINSSISNAPQSKQSGELHVWIYLNNRDSGSCVNVTIGPQKLAGEVCADLAGKMKVMAHELVLQEIICSGSMSRILHHSERVLDTVLRWGYWDDSDRKDNSLVLQKNDCLKEVVPFAKPPLAMSGELRYADRKSKTFKSYVFEFSQAKLCYYRDKKGSMKLNEWKIEDIVWYLGHEPKRNPQTRWCITFIDRNKHNNRSRDSPFFGCTIAGTSRDEQLRWMAALLTGEHPQGILMSPVLLP